MSYKTITAQYNSTCSECGKDIFAGDVVLWLKGHGVKHQTCTKTDDNPKNAFTADDDPRAWKNSMYYTRKTISLVKECQKCGAELVPGTDDDFMHADPEGWRKVCKKCF